MNFDIKDDMNKFHVANGSKLPWESAIRQFDAVMWWNEHISCGYISMNKFWAICNMVTWIHDFTNSHNNIFLMRWIVKKKITLRVRNPPIWHSHVMKRAHFLRLYLDERIFLTPNMTKQLIIGKKIKLKCGLPGYPCGIEGRT